ncbi:MAG: hypothetical protein ABIJ46_03665 [bacterium]
MTLRQYLTMMAAGTALSWGAVCLMVTMIDPTVSRPAVFVVFYASLLLSLTGTFALAGFVSRVSLLGKRDQLSRQVAVSFRQALMLSLTAVAILFMQSQGVLTWWNAVLTAAAATVLEAFFISVGNRT